MKEDSWYAFSIDGRIVEHACKERPDAVAGL